MRIISIFKALNYFFTSIKVLRITEQIQKSCCRGILPRRIILHCVFICFELLYYIRTERITLLVNIEPAISTRSLACINLHQSLIIVKYLTLVCFCACRYVSSACLLQPFICYRIGEYSNYLNNYFIIILLSGKMLLTFIWISLA